MRFVKAKSQACWVWKGEAQCEYITQDLTCSRFHDNVARTNWEILLEVSDV